MIPSVHSADRLGFVLVKAFGDLTIAASTIRRLPVDVRERCTIMIAPHLAELATFLAPGCQTAVLDLGGSLPALFNVRRSPLRAVAASAFELRAALASTLPEATLVFDRLSHRERFIAGGRPTLSISQSPAPNVYLAHARFLQRTWPMHALLPGPDLRVGARRTKRIGLFPFSRVPAKNIPREIAALLARCCKALDVEFDVFLLEGEEFDAIPGVRVERLPRRFDALAQGILSVDAIASADSLPAHLAEYVGRPAFVAMPQVNDYYAPPAAFAGQHWGLFSQANELSSRFERFVRSPS